jgi:hypothetical protein
MSLFHPAAANKATQRCGRDLIRYTGYPQIRLQFIRFHHDLSVEDVRGTAKPWAFAHSQR